MTLNSNTGVAGRNEQAVGKENLLIRRCQQGDISAFKQIFREFQHPLLRTALRITGNQQDAEDAVQTTFLKLYRSIGNFRFGSKFSTYLFRMLMNTSFDLLKHKYRRDMELVEETVLTQQPEPGLKVQLENAIECLPHRMRACFVLFAVEGFSQKEIADILELSIGTVKASIFQAKAKLRIKLAKTLEEE